MGLSRSTRGDKTLVMAETARRALVAALVFVGVVAVALALWKLRLLLALIFAGFILAATMRPTIDALRRRGVPRSVGLGLHYVVFAGLIALVLWFAIPRALTQVTRAVENLPQTRQDLRNQAKASNGIKQDLLLGIQRRLEEAPQGDELVGSAAEVGKTAVEIGIGVFFVFAVAGYWIFERQRAEDVVCNLLPRRHEQKVRDTWELIDLKLGAFVRGQGLMVILVATTLSLLFWLIGLPYWLLVACFAALAEIIPVIGPIVAGGVAVGVGLTDSVHTAVLAVIVVAGVRLLQDYLVLPRVMGGAVGMSPLLVLVAASAMALLFSGWAILLATPFAAVLVTLVDVIVRGKDPADEDTPTVLFPAREAET
jgi:predicted PurR-regulated permease PerM